MFVFIHDVFKAVIRFVKSSFKRRAHFFLFGSFHIVNRSSAKSLVVVISDVYQVPVGSAFIWVRGFESRCIKRREKQSFTKKVFGVFFVRNYIFKSEPKDVANL